MSKADALEMDGTVVDTMRNSQFTVRLDNGHELLAYTGGKMRRFRIRILLGEFGAPQVADVERARAFLKSEDELMHRVLYPEAC